MDDPLVPVPPVPPPAKPTDNPSSVQARTTAEDDRMTAGQRRINIIWEITQALIANTLITAGVMAAIWIVVKDPVNRMLAFMFLTNAVSTVIGFYFGRTNHQRTGGVGAAPASTKYDEGR